VIIYSPLLFYRPIDHAAVRTLAGGYGRITGDLDLALRHLDVALELAPNSIAARVHRGQVHEQRGDLARAIEDLSQALAIAPDTPVALVSLARILVARRDIAARPHLDRALAIQALEPELRFEARCLRARLHGHASRWDEAIADLRAAAESRPQHWYPWFMLAVMHNGKGDLREALACAQRARTMAPAEEHGDIDRVIEAIRNQLK
jgi:tetratricopeptide (TPR) repeat protein